MLPSMQTSIATGLDIHVILYYSCQDLILAQFDLGVIASFQLPEAPTGVSMSITSLNVV